MPRSLSALALPLVACLSWASPDEEVVDPPPQAQTGEPPASPAPPPSEEPPASTDPTGEGDLPPPAGALSVQGPMEPEVVRRLLMRHQHQFTYCYERELRSNPSLRGRVEMAFTIGEGGVVGSAFRRASTLQSPAVENCLAARLMRMRFPDPLGEGSVAVRYVVAFGREVGGRSRHRQEL